MLATDKAPVQRPPDLTFLPHVAVPTREYFWISAYLGVLAACAVRICGGPYVAVLLQFPKRFDIHQSPCYAFTYTINGSSPFPHVLDLRILSGQFWSSFANKSVSRVRYFSTLASLTVLTDDFLPILARSIGIFSLHMLYFLLFTAQCFFMARIYILSKGNLWMSIPPFTLAFAALGLGLYVAARLRIAGEYTEIFSMKTYILVVDILALSCDIFVTSALCYLLHNSRAALQHNVTNSIINRILVNIINRGGLNLVVAVLIMVFLQLSPRTMLL
ncbi:hypothetical protein VKT23_016117 [Stygiomarasmius scandens]|uniref:DUF6534 domain-containing protein n=1 Tax=Marasmiellus scandens TaxID=2682957 RepID=A0ABR1IYY0_9AGAR